MDDGDSRRGGWRLAWLVLMCGPVSSVAVRGGVCGGRGGGRTGNSEPAGAVSFVSARSSSSQSKLESTRAVVSYSFVVQCSSGSSSSSCCCCPLDLQFTTRLAGLISGTSIQSGRRRRLR